MTTVGIVGIGLIGGSMARAFAASPEHTVYGFDKDEGAMRYASENQMIDGELDDARLSECALLIIAVRPAAAISYLREKAPLIGKSCTVIDCCGTKRDICREIFPIAKEYGFTFIGGHPMAGSHKGGVAHSRGNLFHGASMIVVLPEDADKALPNRISELLSPAGFGRLSITTAEQHDRIIAYTSQLAHVVSSAYIKSPTAQEHAGYSAGSYRDLTRVAYLDPDMWTELFIDNKENLTVELDRIIAELRQYRDCIDREDSAELRRLLADGRDKKITAEEKEKAQRAEK